MAGEILQFPAVFERNRIVRCPAYIDNWRNTKQGLCDDSRVARHCAMRQTLVKARKEKRE